MLIQTRKFVYLLLGKLKNRIGLKEIDNIAFQYP
jgi:hypothetical protein